MHYVLHNIMSKINPRDFVDKEKWTNLFLRKKTTNVAYMRVNKIITKLYQAN